MTHTCALRTHVLLGFGRMSSHTHVHGLSREPGISVYTRFGLPDCTCCFCCDVRVCDFAQMCVADACRHVCCGRRCCYDLAACRFFACKNTYTIHTRARVRTCLRHVSREPRPWAVTAHTHLCCRRKESVVALPVAWILFWLHVCAASRVLQKQGAATTMSRPVLV